MLSPRARRQIQLLRRRRAQHPAVRAIRITAGLLLIVAGIVGIFLPIVPQITFLLAGLSLLSPESLLARRLLLRIKLRVRRWRRAVRRRRETPADPGRDLRRG